MVVFPEPEGAEMIIALPFLLNGGVVNFCSDSINQIRRYLFSFYSGFDKFTDRRFKVIIFESSPALFNMIKILLFLFRS